MGQSVTVVEKHSSNPEVLRFEINRSLTGMGHERYRSLDDIVRDRPVDRVARLLLEHGGVDGVHVNSSVITVDLSGGSTGEGLAELIENLFRYYPDEPPAPEAPETSAPEEPGEPGEPGDESSSAGESAEDTGGSGEDAGAAEETTAG